jgi:pimeloyl-ACP methyl ester carboxylesterase
MSSLTVERMVVEVQGDGLPAILVQGLGGSSNTFEPQMEVLRGCRVIRPDLPGSGRSPTPDGPLTIEGLAEGLIRMARSLGADKVHFAGHSMGTIICQHVAVMEPKLVASLALFGALTEPPEAARAGLKKRAAQARTDGMAEIAEAVKTAGTSNTSKANNPAAAAFVRESLMRQCPNGYALTCEALAGARAAEARRIACPTLIVNGDEDQTAPASMARALGDQIERAEVTILPRCGHWAPLEQPKEVNDLLKRFYARHAR